MPDAGSEALTKAGAPPLVDLPREYNAASHFIDRHLAAGRGDKIAYIDDAGRYSYAELARRVNQAGNVLRGLGLEGEQRVMLCLPDGIDFVALFWGAIKAGIVPIPVNTLLTADDYDFMLRDSRAKVLVVAAAAAEKFRARRAAQPALKTILTLGAAPAGGDAGGEGDFSRLREAASEHLDAAATCRDEPAFWLYSSGSTGAPKGTLHLHGSLVQTAVLYGERVLGIREGDVMFSAAKLFFAYGLGNAMTFPLHVGASAVLLAGRPTPEAVAEVMARHRPTLFFGVPTLYAAMLAAGQDQAATGGGRLRACVSAGEALPEDVSRRWRKRFGVEILDGIGSTEMLHIFLSNRPDDIRYGSTGRPVPGYRLRILDEAGRDAAPGEIGELLVSGPSAAAGYWNNCDRTRTTFEGAWVRTGDKYTSDGDGYYQYAGRADDMLKVGGIWVSPFEVEQALAAHPAVLEAAVVGMADADGLIKPKAFVVLQAGNAGGGGMAGTLQAFVKDRLAPYKYPRWVEFLDELPKTATGKIQRFKLRSRDAGGARRTRP